MKDPLVHGLSTRPKAPKKRAVKHGVKSTHVDHHEDGTHTYRHTMHDGSEQTGTAQDMDALHAAMSQNIGAGASAPENEDGQQVAATE
jgi:hypothetical protein